jgi:hypothetical protein
VLLQQRIAGRHFPLATNARAVTSGQYLDPNNAARNPFRGTLFPSKIEAETSTGGKFLLGVATTGETQNPDPADATRCMPMRTTNSDPATFSSSHHGESDSYSSSGIAAVSTLQHQINEASGNNFSLGANKMLIGSSHYPDPTNKGLAASAALHIPEPPPISTATTGGRFAVAASTRDSM